jgi:hypothetical protein
MFAMNVIRQSLSRATLRPLVARGLALDASVKQNIDALVNKQKVVVFMKGEKDSPRCGFSNAVTQVSSPTLPLSLSPPFQ